jgi:quercetin dioxygenase-like cupin family protein
MGKVKVIHTGITDPEKIMEILQNENCRGIFRWFDTPGTYYTWHSHDDYEIRWIYDGELEVGTDEGVFLLKPGDRLEIDKGVRHWAKSEKGVHYIAASK